MGLTVAAANAHANPERPQGACFTITIPERLIVTGLRQEDTP